MDQMAPREVFRRTKGRGAVRFSADAVRRMLADACDQAGGQKNWAAQADVSEAYVCDVIKKRREPGEAICKALGLVRIILYEHK